MTTNKLRNFSYSWYGQRDMAENGQEKKKKKPRYRKLKELMTQIKVKIHFCKLC